MTENKKTLAEEILLVVKDMADIFYDGLPKTTEVYKHIPHCKKNSVVCTLNRLKKDGCLQEVKIDGRDIYRLTDKGKLRIFKSYVNHKSRWDGKWRIVIFDIPESKKNSREIFRSKLKELDFKRLQNSVWICPEDVQHAIKMITEYYKIGDHVQFVIADQISGEKKIINDFKLTP